MSPIGMHRSNFEAQSCCLWSEPSFPFEKPNTFHQRSARCFLSHSGNTPCYLEPICQTATLLKMIMDWQLRVSIWKGSHTWIKLLNNIYYQHTILLLSYVSNECNVWMSGVCDVCKIPNPSGWWRTGRKRRENEARLIFIYIYKGA